MIGSLFPATRPGGFTLLEMLVALAVLTIILTIAVQMLNVMTTVTSISGHQMDATQSTRQVLDGLDRDFATLLTQYNETVCVATSGNPAQFAFLSNTRGAADTNSNLPASTFRYTAITYRLSGNQVFRDDESITWTQVDPMSELLNPPSGAVTSTPVASHILAFQAVLALDNGQIVPIGYVPSSGSPTWTTTTINGKAVTNGYVALVLSKPPVEATTPRVQAITIAVAALDSHTSQLPNVANMSTYLLPPPNTSTNQTPLDTWTTAISSGQLKAFPPAALAALHFDQRTYSLR